MFAATGVFDNPAIERIFADYKLVCYQHLTPAMKMDPTLTQLQWRDLIVAPSAENGHKFSTSTVL